MSSRRLDRYRVLTHSKDNVVWEHTFNDYNEAEKHYKWWIAHAEKDQTYKWVALQERQYSVFGAWEQPTEQWGRIEVHSFEHPRKKRR